MNREDRRLRGVTVFGVGPMNMIDDEDLQLARHRTLARIGAAGPHASRPSRPNRSRTTSTGDAAAYLEVVGFLALVVEHFVANRDHIDRRLKRAVRAELHRRFGAAGTERTL